MKKGITAVFQLQSIIATMKTPILFGSYLAETNNSVQYLSLCYNPRSTNAYRVSDPSDIANDDVPGASMFPCPGTLRNLYVYLGDDSANVGTYLLTIMKNGVPTTLLVTAVPTGSGTPLLLSDTTHSIAVSPGDLFSIQKSTLLTDASFGGFIAAMEFDPS